LEVTFGKRIIFSAANISSVTKGFVSIQAPTHVYVKAFSSDTIDLTLSNITITYELKVSMVGTSMESEASILIQLELAAILATIVLNSSTTLKNVGLMLGKKL
jgi:hypothetical protein